MRKNIIYGMILLAAMACNKENVREEYARGLAEGETKVSLQGKIALPQGEGELLQTKVEFDDVDGKFTWSAQGDTIAVHVTAGMRGEKEMIPTGYKKVMVVPNDPASTCELSFVMSETQARDFFAIYPASVVDEENYGDDELKINLPSEYEIPAAGMDSWCPTPMVAVNDPSIESLSFRHVGGLLRLTLNDVSPATASFEVSLGKRITGGFTVNNPASSVPSIVTDDVADVLTFNLTEPLDDYTSGLILNIPVPTGTYDALSVKAKDEEGEVVFSYEDETERSFYSGRGRRAETVISTVGVPLCFEAVEDASVIITNPGNLWIEYSRDNSVWTRDNGSSINLPLETGECLYLRGDNECYSGMIISTSGECYIYGNIMSLLSSTGFSERFDLHEASTFLRLFINASELLNHPEKSLELPATVLTNYCYSEMFGGCSGLTSMPSLPATTLKEECYSYMFRDCTGLEKTSELPATTLADYCYLSMFDGCSSLSSAPALPALTLAEGCYEAMFYGCSSLTKAPDLPAEVLVNECYCLMFVDCGSLTYIKAMFKSFADGVDPVYVFALGEEEYHWLFNVSETGTFVKNPDVDWGRPFWIPSNWTIEDATE